MATFSQASILLVFLQSKVFYSSTKAGLLLRTFQGAKGEYLGSKYTCQILSPHFSACLSLSLLRRVPVHHQEDLVEVSKNNFPYLWQVSAPYWMVLMGYWCQWWGSYSYNTPLQKWKKSHCCTLFYYIYQGLSSVRPWATFSQQQIYVILLPCTIESPVGQSL